MDNWFKRSITSPIINYIGNQKCNRIFSKPPIFIGGCGRSGTTLLLAILSAHPEVFAIPYETDAFTNWVTSENKLIPKRLDRFHRAILSQYISPSAERWCEKRPANVHYINEILQYFGKGARFINIVRDPRAVCTSIHPTKPNHYWIPIERYVADVNAGLKMSNHPQVFTIKYEDLILDFRNQLSAICNFLDLPLVSKIENWSEYASVKNSKAWSGKLSSLHSESLHKWKSKTHTNRVDEIMNDQRILNLMEHYQYS